MNSKWRRVSPPLFAEVVYPLPHSGDELLPLEVGEMVLISEMTDQWYRGHIVGLESAQAGIFPKNYVHVVPDHDSHSPVTATSTLTRASRAMRGREEKTDDPVRSRVIKAVIEWASVLQDHKGDVQLPIPVVCQHTTALLYYAQQLADLPNDPLLVRQLKREALARVSSSRVTLGHSLVPYDEEGKPMDLRATTIIKLHHIHRELDTPAHTKIHLRVERKSTKTEITPIKREKRKLTGMLHGQKLQSHRTTLEKATASHLHIMLEFRALISQLLSKFASCQFRIEFALLEEGKPPIIISEPFAVLVNASGIPDESQPAQTIIADIPIEWKQQKKIRILSRVSADPVEKSSGRGNKESSDQVRKFVGWSVSPLLEDLPSRWQEQSWTLQSLPSGASFPPIGSESPTGEMQDVGVIGLCCHVLQGGPYGLVSPMMEAKPITQLLVENGVTDNRDDYYITLEEAYLPQERRFHAVEIQICLRSLAKVNLMNRIHCGLEKGVNNYRTVVHTTPGNPQWRETIRLALRPDEFRHAYVQLTCLPLGGGKSSHEKKLVAYFSPTDRSTHVAHPNGVYDVPTFKASRNLDPQACLLGTANSEPLEKQRLVVRTWLRSHRISTNSLIQSLIEWRSNPSLPDTLNKFSFVEMKDVLTSFVFIVRALLEIIRENSALQMFAYNTLIFVLGLLMDDRSEQHHTLMDRLMSSGLWEDGGVHQKLIKCMHYYLSKEDSASHAKYVRGTIRTLPFLLRITVGLYQSSTISQGCTEELKTLLRCLNGVMALQDPLKMAVQVNCVQVYGEIIPILESLFPPDQLVSLVTQFLRCIQENPSLSTSSMNTEKLLLLQSLVNASFYLQSPTAFQPNALVPLMCQIFAQRLTRTRKDIIDASLSILVLLDGMQQTRQTPTAFNALLPLLQPLAEACEKLEYDATHHQNLGVAYLSILKELSPQAILQFLQTPLFPSIEQRLEWVLLICHCNSRLLHHVFPAHWLTLWTFAAQTCTRAVHTMGQTLRQWTEEGLSYPVWTQAWVAYFQFALKLLNLESLQPEALPTSTRKRARSLSNNMDPRLALIHDIQNMWELIASPLLPTLAPVIIPPITSTLMREQVEVAQTARKFLEDLIQRVYEDTGNLSLVANGIVQRLCFISDAEGLPPTCQRMLLPSLRQLFTRPGSSPAWKEEGLKLLKMVEELVRLLLECESLPAGVQWEDERTSATLKIMEFLKKAEHPEPYITHIHQLSQQHKDAQRYAEAGQALLLHAAMLSFTSDALLPQTTSLFPAQLEWQRKEALYTQAIDYFNLAKEWERSVELTRELAAMYERTRVDFTTLSRLLQQQSQLFHTIATSERFAPAYFRVAFEGDGFPASLRAQEFVYRGYECERITSFIARMEASFPQAEIFHDQEEYASASKSNAVQMYLIIHTVYPSSLEAMTTTDGHQKEEALPDYVVFHRMNGHVRVFSYSRPFRKALASEEDRHNEFKNLYNRDHFLITEEAFPTIHSRSKVEKHETIERSPIEMAVRSMEKKSQEMAQLCLTFSAPSESQGDTVASLNSLTMALNGVIDAEVNGGIRMYREAFLLPPSRSQLSVEDQAWIPRLEKAIQENMTVVGRALDVHRKRCPSNLLQLQEKLDQFYQEKMLQTHPG